MSAPSLKASESPTDQSTRFLWLEITGKCSLECVHCYANSSPEGTHGEMGETDWLRVIGQAAGLGVNMVQFIGGEPTLNPLLPTLVSHALSWSLEVEVFSNLVAVPRKVWEVLRLPGVRLATSYYSGKPEEHEAITQRRGSHRHTTGNIAKAVEFGVPLRVGVIQVEGGQDVEGARRLLAEAGVCNVHVGFDRLREVGRGVREGEDGLNQLCGNCGHGNAAVLPDGRVTPCVFSRSLTVGNVLESPLEDILSGQRFTDTRATLMDYFVMSGVRGTCDPNDCGPTCNPGYFSPGKSGLVSVASGNCVPAAQCQPSNQAPPH